MIEHPQAPRMGYLYTAIKTSHRIKAETSS
jgi:hypothetical protein